MRRKIIKKFWVFLWSGFFLFLFISPSPYSWPELVEWLPACYAQTQTTIDALPAATDPTPDDIIHFWDYGVADPKDRKATLRDLGKAIGPPATQSLSCADSGDGNPGTLTITPTAGVGRVDISLTVNDANGCTITMAEVAAVEETLVIITNISAANTATFTTSAGVLTLKYGSPLVLGAKQSLILIYKGSEWLEVGRTGGISGVALGGFTASKAVESDGSGNLTSSSFNFGTMTDTKWCQYTAAGGLACTQNTPAGSSITVSRIPIYAGSMEPDTSSGYLQTKASNNIFGYLEFKTAIQYAIWKWIPPADWDAGTVKFKAIWDAGEAMTNADTITFGVAAIATADGVTQSQAITTGRITWTDAYATADETGPLQKVTAASGALTIDGTPTADKMITFRFDIDSTNHKKVWLEGFQMQIGLTGSNPSAW